MRSSRPRRNAASSAEAPPPGKVRFYALDENRRPYAIGLRSLESIGADPDSALPSRRLLSHSALPASANLRELLWPFHPNLTAEPGGLVGLGVRRVVGAAGRYPGEVVAIRGAAKLAWDQGDRFAIVRDLLEIRFHERRIEAGGPPEILPPLSGDDGGEPVVSAYGEALGLIVGGSDYRCALVPLRPYLLEHGLQLANPADYDQRDLSEKWRGQLDHDVTSLFDDLATTPPYPFGDPLEEAA